MLHEIFTDEESRWLIKNAAAIRQAISGEAAIIPLEYDGQPLSSISYCSGEKSPAPGLSPIPSYKAFDLQSVRLDKE